MALILNLETSTTVCSAALVRDGKVIAQRESFEDKSHASSLTVFIDQILKEAGMEIRQLDAVAISQGPGSYTGLRIGVSTAKGICYALSKPLIALNTLQAMALMALGKIPNKDSLMCTMIDARRMEVYAQFFDAQANPVREIKAEIIEENTYSEWLLSQEVYFIGDGAAKCKTILSSPNAKFIDNIYPSANYMAEMAEKAFNEQQFVDVAYFEPFYLKDFVATVPKNKVV